MKIGLTGSIACGKSTVSQHLKQKGCQIVDADAISRALTADGGAALPEIRKAFGDGVFSGAALDRAKLGQLVFADAQKRETLNAILHPMILAEIRRQNRILARKGIAAKSAVICAGARHAGGMTENARVYLSPISTATLAQRAHERAYPEADFLMEGEGETEQPDGADC